MILLISIGWLGCAPEPKPDSTPVVTDTTPPFVPVEGVWTIAWAEEYNGTCALKDMDTRQPASIDWRVELESNGFTFYDEYDYPLGCDLVDTTFRCSMGTYSTDYAVSGYDAFESITTTISGEFKDEETFKAIYAIAAECSGADCLEIGQGYGRDFVYPCVAEADFDGELKED